MLTREPGSLARADHPPRVPQPRGKLGKVPGVLLSGAIHSPRGSMNPEDTSLQLDALAYAPFASRSDPQLHWSIGARSHTYVIGGRTVIGTAEGVDIVVQVPGVSRLHAALEPTEDGVWIRDLGSKNGTFVGGIRVAHARIPDEGRQIQLGSVGNWCCAITFRRLKWSCGRRIASGVCSGGAA